MNDSPGVVPPPVFSIFHVFCKSFYGETKSYGDELL